MNSFTTPPQHAITILKHEKTLTKYPKSTINKIWKNSKCYAILNISVSDSGSIFMQTKNPPPSNVFAAAAWFLLPC